MTPDLQYLADATRCPSCSAVLPAERNACAACGLRLTGVLAGRLWQVSVQAAELLETRRLIIEQLRHEPAMAPTAATPPPGAGPAACAPPAGTPRPRPAASPSGPAAGSRTCCSRSASACSLSPRSSSSRSPGTGSASAAARP